MTSQCSKCAQITNCSQILLCGHFLCGNCFPVWNYSHQLIITCPNCLVMTILSNDNAGLEADPQNYVVCLQCKSDVMSTRAFLDSPHRKHDVVSIVKIYSQVQKNLRKYQLSIDLQNQALYSQVQLISKQKRNLSEQFSKKLIEIRYSFDQLKNSVQQCQQACINNFEKIILQAVGAYDTKIKQLKYQILKCQSYMECIDHCLVKSNSNKHIGSTQFFFQNSIHFDKLLSQLIETRKHNFNSSNKSPKIEQPDLNGLKQIIKSVKSINLWRKQQIKVQETKKSKQNPENDVQKYFQLKRRQIFDKSVSSESKQEQKKDNRQIQNRASKIVQNLPSNRKSGLETIPDNYNIQGRIENLRKTLKLGDRSNSTKQFNLLHK